MKYPNKIGSIACFSCLCMPISAYADINLNGFATIGLGQVVNTNVEDGKGQIYGIEEDISLAQGSLIGLQFGADMGDGLTATAQIISKGSNDWVPETEWAYISYDVSDQVRIIAGKQRSPYYMYSEFVDVGYAYHWISPPEGVYSLPFDSTNSVSAIINNYFGDFETNLQLMYGQNEKDISFNGPTTVTTKNALTANLTVNYEWLTLRGGVTYTEVDLPLPALSELISGWESAGAGVAAGTEAGALAAGAPASVAAQMGAEAGAEVEAVAEGIVDGILIEEDDTIFASAGVSIDFDWIFFVAEYTQLNMKESLVGINHSTYASLGGRYNEFTVHTTVGYDKDIATDLLSGLPDVLSTAPFEPLISGTESALSSAESESYYGTVGGRWDFHDSAAFKLDMTAVNNKLDQDGDYMFYRASITTVF
jgi:hypothetical protein